ncbi:MAG: DNA adenine methylase [Ignavibacteria bacterium]|nr:DNA adenine methylase [Ignavibacteria bacterium]
MKLIKSNGITNNSYDELETLSLINYNVSYYNKEKRLTPIIKWPGGKDSELNYILPQLPKQIENFYDPFVGGGAVYFAVKAKNYFINDKSDELINLYLELAKKNNELFFNLFIKIIENWKALEEIVRNNNNFFIQLYRSYHIEKNLIKLKDKITQFILEHNFEFKDLLKGSFFNMNIENFLFELNKNLTSKINNLSKIEDDGNDVIDFDLLQNIETALKSAFYMHFRHLYNNSNFYQLNRTVQTVIFYFIRNQAYSGMFRYNSKGEFNVPYGGIQYNRKDFNKKLNYFRQKDFLNHLSKTKITSLDFEDFILKFKPSNNDFVFLDPPYDSEFSTYTKNVFGKEEHIRLANLFIKNCKAKWMLVIKNTEFIVSLYEGKGLHITSFDKRYLVSFKNRNNPNTKHLIIKNYD